MTNENRVCGACLLLLAGMAAGLAQDVTGGSRVYECANLLRNGDFRQEPYFGGETPLFWIPNYYENPMSGQKEVLSRYRLKDGVLTMRAPAISSRWMNWSCAWTPGRFTPSLGLTARERPPRFAC